MTIRTLTLICTQCRKPSALGAIAPDPETGEPTLTSRSRIEGPGGWYTREVVRTLPGVEKDRHLVSTTCRRGHAHLVDLADVRHAWEYGGQRLTYGQSDPAVVRGHLQRLRALVRSARPGMDRLRRSLER